MSPRSRKALMTLGTALIGAVLLSLFLIGLVWAERSVEAPTSSTQDALEIKMFSAEWIHVDEVLTYTIWVTNTSGAALNALYVTDTWSVNLPQNLWSRDILPHFITYSANPPSAVTYFTHVHNLDYKRGEAYWHLGPLADGESVKLVLSVTVPITLEPALNEYEGGRVGPSSIENSLVVDPQVEAPSVAHNATMVRAPLVRVETEAVQEAAPSDKIRVGRLMTLTWTLSNLDYEGTLPRPDTEDASHLKLYVLLPAQFINSIVATQADVADVATAINPATGWFTWTFPSDYLLATGEETHLTMTVRLPADTAYNPAGQKITFGRDDMLIDVAERLEPEWSLVTIKRTIVGPLDKVVQALYPPRGDDHTYPNRPITYTLTFYNPLQTALTGATLTDTLFPDFIFITQTDGSLPLPTGNGNTIRWENISIPANGMVTATFRVSVTAQTEPDACNGVRHYNAMTIAHSAFPNGGLYIGDNWNRTAQVVVDRQVYVKIVAEPSLQLPGELVTYTVTVGNYSPEQVNGPFVVTVTLPVSFTYYGMVSSAPPAAPTVISDHILVWDDVPSLPGGDKIEFSFQAIADGEQLARYKSLAELYSTRTRTCPYLGAEVKIDVPFRVNKIALTDTVVMGEDVGYQVFLHNVSPRNAYTLTYFEDILPAWTVDAADGDGAYTLTDGLPYEIGPNGEWSSPVFSATYVGGGLGTELCFASFSNRSIVQNAGNLHFDIDGEGTFVNAENLASVSLLPQVSIDQEVWPNPVAYSHTQILTITLHDNRTKVLTDITGLKVHWEAPTVGDATYRVAASDPPTVSQSGADYYWNVTLPGGEEATIVLTLTAPMPADKSADFIAHVQVDEADDPSICVDQDDIRLRVRRGLRVKKLTYDSQVGPFGLVRYRVLIYNDLGIEVNNIVFTDILPLDWSFEYAEAGFPEPISIDPPVWEIESIPPLGVADLRFAARAYNYLGLWYNDFTADAPYEVFKDSSYTDTVDVQVISGIGMYKVVAPKEARIGETVLYTITVYNGSSDKLYNFRITDTLPSGLSYDGMMAGPSPTWITPTTDGEMLVWEIGSLLNPQYELNLAFRAAIADDLYSGLYYNDLTGEAVNYDTGDRVILPPAEHTAPLRIHGKPSGEIEKTVSPASAMAGEVVTYTISLHSMADLSYTVQLTDTLPPSLTFESAVSSPAPTVLQGADGRHRLVWSVDEIAPDERRDFIFRARIDRLAEGTYCNDVAFQMGEYPQPAQTGLACLEVTPLPRIDGQVSVDDGEYFIAAGKRLTYTIHYTNAATSGLALYDLVLTDEITPLTYITPLPGTMWTDLGNGRYRYTAAGPLDPGESGTVTFVVQADSSVPEEWDRPLVNNVAFTYTTHADKLEFNLFNNYASDMDSWQGRSPDLIVESLTYQPDQPEPGEPMTLTARIRNVGQGDVARRWDGSTDADYLFVLEFYLRPHPSSPPDGVFDHTGGWSRSYDYLTWSGPLAAGETRILTAHVTAPEDGEYDFYAQVDISDDCTECAPWGKSWGLIAEEDESNNIYTYPGGTVEIRGTSYIYLPLVLRNH